MGKKFPLLLLIGRTMEDKINDLKINLCDAVQSMEIFVDDVYYETKDNYNFLVVVLDKIGGIDLDAIVGASKIINEIVDNSNLPYENYILDIVSKERG